MRFYFIDTENSDPFPRCKQERGKITKQNDSKHAIRKSAENDTVKTDMGKIIHRKFTLGTLFQTEKKMKRDR